GRLFASSCDFPVGVSIMGGHVLFACGITRPCVRFELLTSACGLTITLSGAFGSEEEMAVDEIRAGLGDAWSAIVTFVPKLLMFLIVLLIGWLIAKAVSKGLSLLLQKLGFARLVDKTGLARIFQQSNIDAGGIIVKNVYYFILLIALQIAFGVFGPTNPVSQLLNDVIAFLPRIAVAIVLVLVAAAIGNAVRELVGNALAGRGAARGLATAAYWVILALGVIAALSQIGVGELVTGPVLIAVLATVGGVIVVGFGGGLIRATSERWPRWLDSIEQQFSSSSAGGRPAPGAGPGAGPATGGMSGDLRE